MIYLDNAATTIFKPQQVIDAVCDCLKSNAGNPGRSGHSAAVRAGFAVMTARKKVADFFGGSAERTIFTSGCTEALNLAILGNIRSGHIVVSCLEHNSVLRPLKELERLNRTTFSVVEPDKNGVITADIVKNALTPSTYMVAVTHVSNVTGAINPIREIGKYLQKTRVMFLVDAAQSAGHYKIDMEQDGIDLLAIAGHKGLHGAQGVGALLLGGRIDSLCPIKFGGTGTSSESLFQPDAFPEGFESGTGATPLIVGLGAAVDYCLQNDGHAAVQALAARLLTNLKKIDGVTIYTPKNCFSGVVAFNIGTLTSPEVCDILDNEYGIAVRGGLHCAPLAHKYLGTLESGAVRASLSSQNTAKDVDALLDAVYEIAQRTFG